MDNHNVRDEIGLLLAVSSQLFQSRITQLLARHDLSYSQFSLLSHLRGAAEPSTISALAAAMEINQPGVTKVVKRLHDLGLVTIDGDPADSRKRLVSLAPAAGERLAEIEATLDVDSSSWFDGWPEDQLSQFRDSLADLTAWLDANRLENRLENNE